MTITPLPVLPPATRGGNPRAAAGKPGQPSPAEDFAAVLSGHLADAKEAGPQLAAPQPDEPSTDAVPADPAAGGVEAQLAGSAVVTAPAAPSLPTDAAPAAAPAAPGTAAVPAGVPTSAGAATDKAGHLAADPAARPAAAAPAGTTPQPAAHPTADPARTPAVPADVSLPSDGAVEAPEHAPEHAAGAPATAAAPEQDDTPATGQAPVGVAAPTAGVTPADTVKTAPATSAPVLAQVSPALARVVSRGDGEHRMMLKLHPADLGEVHLTVTVRGDHVDVEIAASPEARAVLRDGSAHLRSLLESIGRSTGQLVLRDLPVAPTPATGPGAGGSGHDGGAATTYADTGDGRRDQPDTGGGRQQPHAPDQPRPVVTPRASGRSTVPGGPALDVTV